MTQPETRLCDNCFEEFIPGKGATEVGASRTRLTERFCSESCAEEHEKSMSDGDDE